MKSNNSSRAQNKEGRNSESKDIQQTSGSDKMDKLQKEADKERSRKPGSQSNSSKQGNNGRGGGK
jgi:hypothetical protein